MSLRSAVEATPEIRDSWQKGLQALKEIDRNRLNIQRTRNLTGSVDLDTALQQEYPEEPRWDYAVGYKHQARETVYWIEVHPSTPGEVKTVLAKHTWLKRWLLEKAPQLHQIQREFIWIASGRTSITQTSPQAKRLASAGIRHSGSRLRIP